MSQSFEDACLGSSNPITNPVINFPWNTLTKGGSAISGLPGSITSKIGKRDDETLANRDIVFVLDSSGSIPNDQFIKAKKAINILIQSFCPSKLGQSQI